MKICIKETLTKIFILCALLLLASVLVCCGEKPAEDGDVSDADADTDSDSDADTDSDSDADERAVIAFEPIDVTNWVEPPGVGGELGPSVPALGFEIIDEQDGEITVLMGTLNVDAEGNILEEQDTCNPTTEFTGTVDEEGYFELGPQNFPAVIAYTGNDSNGVEHTILTDAIIYNMKLSGILNEARDGFAGERTRDRTTQLNGTVDVREIASLFSLTFSDEDPVKICEEIVDTYPGAQCGACPDSDENAAIDGSNDFCLNLTAWRVSGATVGITFEEVSAIGDGCIDQ
ncbi:MAG: hypothetical protein JXX14_20025 [Deltaproteobacteria bacterium]|nr:hypothetical protein [Deltaproteobacteria bacterium]